MMLKWISSPPNREKKKACKTIPKKFELQEKFLKHSFEDPSSSPRYFKTIKATPNLQPPLSSMKRTAYLRRKHPNNIWHLSTSTMQIKQSMEPSWLDLLEIPENTWKIVAMWGNRTPLAATGLSSHDNYLFVFSVCILIFFVVRTSTRRISNIFHICTYTTCTYTLTTVQHSDY